MNSQNPLLNHDPVDVRQQHEVGVGRTPSVGTHTHSSPCDENYNNELSPADAVKELMRVRL